MNIIPVVTYSNAADTLKSDVLKYNKDKAGIYRWVNLINGKSYVGSFVNLSNRFRKYYSVNFLEKITKKDKSKIYNSLFKNGYSNFKLEILEYYSPPG